MKLLFKTMMFAGCLLASVVYASISDFDLDESDFVMVDGDMSIDDFVTIRPTETEVSPQASLNVKWQFELANKSPKPFYVMLRDDTEFLLPDTIAPAKGRLIDRSFELKPGKTVRLGRLDTSKKLRLMVLTPSEAMLESLTPEQISSLIASDRALIFNFDNYDTAFLEITPSGELIPAKPVGKSTCEVSQTENFGTGKTNCCQFRHRFLKYFSSRIWPRFSTQITNTRSLCSHIHRKTTNTYA